MSTPHIFTQRVLTLLAAALLSACASSGEGTGSTLQGDVTATLAWKSDGEGKGVITANMNTGESFSGRYFQVSRETRVEELEPLWAGWGWPRNGWGMWWGPWASWEYWGPQPSFVSTYTGRVVANLAGPDGTHMRCRFTLQYPSSGMTGGGVGTCQLPSGKVIDTILTKG